MDKKFKIGSNKKTHLLPLSINIITICVTVESYKYLHINIPQHTTWNVDPSEEPYHVFYVEISHAHRIVKYFSAIYRDLRSTRESHLHQHHEALAFCKMGIHNHWLNGRLSVKWMKIIKKNKIENGNGNFFCSDGDGNFLKAKILKKIRFRIQKSEQRKN